MLFNQKGFSLTELLVSVSIIGILSFLGIGQYSKFQNRAKATIVGVEIREIEKSFKGCLMERDSPYKWDHDSNTTTDAVWASPVDCLTQDIAGHYEINTIVSMTFNKDSGNTKGCFSIQHNDAKPDAKGTQCIDFLLSDRGMRNNHYKDDGTKNGTCSSGECE